MSNLTLTVDYKLRQLIEPGFHRFVSTRQLADTGWPEDQESHQATWRDPLFKTVMMKPLQLESDWIDTPQAGSSIIRLANLVTSPTDISNLAVFEQPVAGNTDNPWIHHNPVGPSTGFPTAPNPMPGAGPSLTGVTMGDDASGLPLVSVTPPEWYLPSATMPPYNSLPTPTSVGGITSSKMVAYSAEHMPPNQALFLRWFVPDNRIGYQGVFWWYVGQFVIGARGPLIEVWRDSSTAGNRTSFEKVMTSELFGATPQEVGVNSSFMSAAAPEEKFAQDRSLLWLPFRQNQVLLYASTGKAASFFVNSRAERLSDNSDWNITRSDTVGFRCLTKAPGRFQIQKVLYAAGPATIQTPPYQIEYTPTFTPVITIYKDSDYGSTITATQTAPPGYTIPTNLAHSTGPKVTNSTDQSRTYGVKVILTASGDQRHTPFFYGFLADASRVFGNSPATEVDVGDANPATGIVNAKLSAGLKPGEGRMTVDVIESSSYELAPKYYHSGMPLRLVDNIDGTIFVGISEPNEVVPLRGTTNMRRRVVMSANDRTKQLAYTWLRDQRDYSGVGHIDVVKFIAEQGGIECTSAEFPPYTPGVIDGQYNSALGDAYKSTAQLTKETKCGWQPQDKETAQDFIKRIAERYSGWYWGFRLDGTFFYLPRDFFTTSSVTFTSTKGGASPHFSNPVTFRTREPEANVIAVIGNNALDGSPMRSKIYVDWASVKTPASVNYLGRFKREVVKVGGSYTPQALNWIARKIWDQTRRRFIDVEFEADWVPTLKIGQCFTLGSYGLYRCTGFSVELKTHSQHRATYKGEFIELGYSSASGSPTI